VVALKSRLAKTGGNVGRTSEVAPHEAELDPERLAQLRVAALASRGPRGRIAQRHLMRLEGSPSRSRDHLRSQSSRRVASPPQQSSASSSCFVDSSLVEMDELSEDETYRGLVAKYGHRLRTPRPPPGRPPADRRVVTSTCAESRKPLNSMRRRKISVSGVPPSAGVTSRPSAVPGAGGGAGALSGAGECGDADAGVSTPEPASGGARRSAADERGEGDQVGRTSTATVQLPQIPQTPRVMPGVGGDSSAQIGVVAEVAATAAAVVAAGASVAPAAIVAGRKVAAATSGVAEHGEEEDDLPVPARSLMPRKELLRRKQQALLKKTDVVFYRGHMRKQFQRILEAVELTYSDTDGKRRQSKWNLAKPPTLSEMQGFPGRDAQEI